jgi:protein-tyrosine phosphatase
MTGKEHPPTNRVLFVCTGNYYRSRLAEALFRHYSASAGLGWDPFSRGLTVTGAVHGIAPEAQSFLELLGIPSAVPPRDPLPLLVDELITAGHVVLLNRVEHEPVIGREFRAVYRRLLEKNAVIFWNVFDFPPKKALWGKGLRPSQPVASATEHIHFAVKDLIRMLMPRDENPALDEPEHIQKRN